MIFWKSWFDVRGRFWLCTLLVVLATMPHATHMAINARVGEPGTELDVDRRPGPPTASEADELTWRQYVGQWYRQEGFIFVLFAVTLTVGGTLADANARTNVLTLSTPVRRRRWLAAQAVMAGLLTCALIVLAGLTLALVALCFGRPFPVKTAALGSFAMAVGSAVWVGPSLLSTSYMRESVKAGIVVFALVIGTRFSLSTRGAAASWNVWTISDVAAWVGAVPWSALGVGAAVCAGCYWLAARRFERADY